MLRESSIGSATQTLTIPLATATWVVAERSRSKCGDNPGSKRPEDHKAVYPRPSISAAASTEASSLVRHVPLHQAPTLPRSTPRIVPMVRV